MNVDFMHDGLLSVQLEIIMILGPSHPESSDLFIGKLNFQRKLIYFPKSYQLKLF